MALKLNVWYKVVKDYSDTYGYRLVKGWFIRPKYQGPYSTAYRMSFDRLADGRYDQLGQVFIASDWDHTKYMELLPDPKEVEDIIFEGRRDNPDAHANLSADMYIGTDPELFVFDSKDRLIPAFSFLPKEKDAKIQDGAEYRQKQPYWDGFQAEFQTTPATCHVSLTTYVRTQIKVLYQASQAFSKGAKLSAAPVVVVPKKLLETCTDEQAALGCAPSKNAYGHKGEKISDGRELGLRFAGFHIHHSIAGYTMTGKKLIKDPATLVKSMDNICGVMSVSVLEGMEDPIRRKYYGLAGEYRTPKHGLEYRVLSSAPLWHPAMSYLHLDFARGGCQLAMAGLADLWEGSEEETVDIINNLDVDQARKALQRNKRLMVGLLGRYYGRYDEHSGPSTKKANRIFEGLFLKGFGKLVDLDVEKNWGVTHNHSPQLMAGFADTHFKAKTMVAGR